MACNREKLRCFNALLRFGKIGKVRISYAFVITCTICIPPLAIGADDSIPSMASAVEASRSSEQASPSVSRRPAADDGLSGRIGMLEDEVAQNHWGGFLWPNEFWLEDFARAVEKKEGVYLGVGTFRTLGMLGLGNFSHGILLDYDSTVVKFNRANLQLIKTSKDRCEYLSRLFGADLTEADIVQLDSGKIPSKLNSLERNSPAEDIFQMNQARPAQLSALRQQYMRRRDQWRMAIFGSDKIFSRVKALAEADQIKVVLGNVTEEGPALTSIRRELTKSGVEISVVDTANVGDSFDSDGKLSLLSTLRKLPLSKDAIHLSTSVRTAHTNPGIFAISVESFSAPENNFHQRSRLMSALHSCWGILTNLTH